MRIAEILVLVGIIYFAVIFLCIVCLCCGKCNTKSCQGLTQSVQKIVSKIFAWLKNTLCYKCVSRVGNYCMYEKNPLMQLFYLTLITGNVFGYFVQLYPKIHEYNSYVPPVARYFAYVMILVAYFNFFLVSFSNPGIVTKKTIKHVEKAYPYDKVLYHPKLMCKTCEQRRPARSKHCRYTKRCVSKFDHFCPWINNTVGEYNYRYFHYFLLSNFVIALTGFWGYVLFIYGVIDKDNLFSATFVTNHGDKVQATFPVILQFMLHNYIFVLAQAFLLGALVLMLTFFEGFHLFRLAMKNTTTYENFKWDDIKKQMRYIISDPNNPKENFYIRPKQRQAVLELYKKGGRRITNPYDKGMIENLKEVVFPPSLQRKFKLKKKKNL